MDILIAGTDKIIKDDFDVWYVPLIEQGIRLNSTFYVENVASANSTISLFSKIVMDYFIDNEYYNVILCSNFEDGYVYNHELCHKCLDNKFLFTSRNELNTFMVENTDKEIIFIKNGDDNKDILEKILLRYYIP